MFDFDDEGFDHAPDGTPTGWRAFAYMPLPSTFWPANGSTDDVLIRLPEAYREPLVLRLVEGMTGPEIAARTGLKPESVRVNLHRGLGLLRERMGSDE